MTQSTNETLEHCKALLEYCANRGQPIVLIDAGAGRDSQKAAMKLALELSHSGAAPAIMGVPAAHLPDLYIAMPPEHEARFHEGLPVVIDAVWIEDRAKHPKNHPEDTPVIAAAKTALEVGAFGLQAEQTAVEISKNSRNRSITRKEAGERADTKLADAIWRDGRKIGDGPVNRFGGLIDRGRRKVVNFFGVLFPRRYAQATAAETKHRIATAVAGSKPLIEEDIVSRASALARHESRAVAHETAMYRWKRNVDEGKPITEADMRDVANAHAIRQDGTELVRIAISGDLDPFLVHRNHGQMRSRFQLGVKLGRLMRNQSIEFTATDAKALETAFETVRRGPPETDQDSADYFLVDAAGKCLDGQHWYDLIARVTDTGAAETVHPRENPPN